MTEQAIQIGAIAVLLLVTYAVGWCLGYVLHRTVSRRPAPAGGEATHRTSSPPADPALAAAAEPTTVVATAAMPVEIGATIPEPMRAGSMPTGPDLPAVSALETLKSLSTVMPLVPAAAAIPVSEQAPAAAAAAAGNIAASGSVPRSEDREATSTIRSASSAPEVTPIDAAAATPGMIVSAMPAVAPGIAWSGQLHGREAGRFVAGSATAKPTAGAVGEVGRPAVTASEPDVALSAEKGSGSKLRDDEFPSEPSLPSLSPPSANRAELELPAAAAPASIDEDSAMRDVEGGWSRRGIRTTAEMTDVSAAVNAAQVAVEQVLARSGVDPDPAETIGQVAFGRPRGLLRPRDGGRDDLKQIVGLGPMDESALNNLGIYHFDQIANLDEREVLWLENHAFARGRIGREEWQRQARQLSVETAALRVGR